jgi:hypothetical protein
LEKFEIASPLPRKDLTEDQKYFVPSLIQTSKPDKLKQNIPNSSKRIYCFEYLPFGFFNRLVIRLLHFMESIEVSWKDGIVIRNAKDRTICIIEQVVDTILELSIEVYGFNQTKYLRLVVESIEILIHGENNL